METLNKFRVNYLTLSGYKIDKCSQSWQFQHLKLLLDKKTVSNTVYWVTSLYNADFKIVYEICCFPVNLFYFCHSNTFATSNSELTSKNLMLFQFLSSQKLSATSSDIIFFMIAKCNFLLNRIKINKSMLRINSTESLVIFASVRK